MTDDDFLQAISAEPDSDMHRLVYADWLEERGDERAEFLRLDCELQACNPEDEAYAAKESHWLDLWERIDSDWIESLMGPRHRVEEVQLFRDLLMGDRPPVLAAHTSLFGGYFRGSTRQQVDKLLSQAKPRCSRTMGGLYYTFNRRGYPVADILGTGDWFLVLSKKERDAMFRNNVEAGWTAFWKRFPNCSGLHRISRVGFNPQCTQAILYHAASVGSLAGGGGTILCLKSEGKWHRECEIGGGWIS